MKYSLLIFILCGLHVSCTQPKSDGSANFSSTCNSSPEPMSHKAFDNKDLDSLAGRISSIDPSKLISRAKKYSEQLQEKKLNLDSAGPKAEETLSLLKKNQKLVALLDHSCVAESSPSILIKSILAQNHQAGVVEVEALEFKLDRDQYKDDLEAILKSEPCLLQVNLPKSVHTTATFNDPFKTVQRHLDSLNFYSAYEKFFEQIVSIQSDVVVAIVDTGVKYTHEDLVGQMWDDGAGHPGYDFLDGDNDPMDESGHGTHVAGLVAASSNTKGGLGIMPTRVKIMAVRVLSDSGGSVTSVVNGINYAVSHGAHVINLSLGTEGTDASILAALQNAVANGVVVTAAAGNEHSEISSRNMFIPAAYARDIEGVISVTSHDTVNMALSGFSNFSPNYIEISAPGAEDSKRAQALGGIYSTYYVSGNSGYIRLMGTSMSSPIAAGAAALTIGLLKAYGKTPTPSQVEYLIKASALRYGSLWSKVQNGRVLDLDRLADFVTAYGAGVSVPTTSSCR